MTELQDKVAESNKAIQRVEESLSARLSVLEREFRYTSTSSSSTHDGAMASKMTRASEGQVDPHLGQLQKLEQLAKVYGMSIIFSKKILKQRSERDKLHIWECSKRN